MNNDRLKICIVTGSRAEYGLFYPLLRELNKEGHNKLQLIATGMHLSPEFGLTYKQIQADGFRIDEKVEMLLSGDTPTAITKSTGIGMVGYADAFHRLQPDWVVLLGDRFETFAAAAAAHLAAIPIAHLHGGEVTEGATDDAMRHAITKMAYLHFTAAETYRKRVIQLGEEPARVFNVGAIGLDNVKLLKLMQRDALSEDLQFTITENTVLVTYHPVTLEKNTAEQQIKNLLEALDAFPDLNIIFTLPNADAEGRVIIQIINEYVNLHPERAKAFTSLGQVRYLSTLKYVKAVIGNSSSGIIEAPYFKIPTVNIGDRQTGRLKATSIIDTGYSVPDIINALEKAFSPSFSLSCKSVVNPYGSGNTALEITRIIEKWGRLISTQKKFNDLPQI